MSRDRLQVLISCGATKLPHAAPALELYCGSYFKSAAAWARSVVPAERIFIVSAKYGIVRSDEILEPYEAQMGTPSQLVTIAQLRAQAAELGLTSRHGERVFVGGRQYVLALDAAGVPVIALSRFMGPKAGLGVQRGWLARNAGQLPAELEQLFATFASLAAMRTAALEAFTSEV